MTRSRFVAVVLAISGVCAMALSARAQSPASPAQQTDHQRSTGQAPMMMSDAQMMNMHQKMMADMKTMDVKLGALIAKMNQQRGRRRGQRDRRGAHDARAAAHNHARRHDADGRADDNADAWLQDDADADARRQVGGPLRHRYQLTTAPAEPCGEGGPVMSHLSADPVDHAARS